jgi:hypothetical protein
VPDPVTDADLSAQLYTIVAPHLDGVVQRAARRAKLEIPVYENVPEVEIRQGIARDVSVVLGLVRDRRGANDEERQALGIIGDTRARQGLPLESMLRVYRITLDEAFLVIWQAGEDGELTHDAALALTRAVWRRADDAMETAVAAYRHRELKLSAAESEKRAALLHAVLFSPAGAPEEMVCDAGLDPAAEHLAFRVRVPAERTHATLSELQLPGVLAGGIAGVYGDDVIGFATAPPRVVLGGGAIVGVGTRTPIAGLSRSFAVASRIVDTAVAFGRTGVLAIADVALEAIARAEDVLGDSLVDTLLAPAAEGGPELAETLRSLFAHDLSTERVAQALGVHPNTVRKRVHRYEELTGVSLQNVDDAMRVRLALLRDELSGVDDATPNAPPGGATEHRVRR